MTQRLAELALPQSHVRHPSVHVRLLHWRRRLPKGALRLVRWPGPPPAGALTIERPRLRYNWDIRCVQQLAAAACAGRQAYQPGLGGAAVRRVRVRPLAPKDPCEYVPIARAIAALLPQHHARPSGFLARFSPLHRGGRAAPSTVPPPLAGLCSAGRRHGKRRVEGHPSRWRPSIFWFS